MMTTTVHVGGAFLDELLARGERAQPARTPGPVARAIAEHWRRAVSGGADGLFARRLAAEGLSEGEVLVRLQGGMDRLASQKPRWLSLLQRAVPPRAKLGAVPSLLTRAVEPALTRSFAPPLFSPEVGRTLAHQLHIHLHGLLEHAGAPASSSAWDHFAERPLLARLFATRTRQWVRCCGRLVHRLRHDRRDVQHLLGETGAFRIAEVVLGLSDRHGDGESVARLLTQEGAAFYYKPRSLEPERVLGLFFEALRGVGVRLPPLPAMVVRPGYGWVREVPWASLATRREVARWFFAAGSLAAVAWLLGLGDLHWENVVAGEEGPVVVDGEAWCCPFTDFDREEEQDILASGLVTFPTNGPRGARDDGALLAGTRPEARSLPLFAGRVVDPRAFREEVMAGARDALEKLLWARRGGQLKLPLAELSGLRVRWVARPSEAYAAFLSSAVQNPRIRHCWHLSMLAETRWRPLLAANFCKPALRSLLRRETEALESFAIPRLTLPAARRGGIVRRSGKDRILRRLSFLTGKCIEEQLRILAAAFPKPWAAPLDGLLDAGREVAAALVEKELSSEPGPFLRRGWAGRAIAWAAWARATGDESAAGQARWCLDRVQTDLEREDWKNWHPGFASGLGGVIYAFLACGRWLEEPRFFEVARQLATAALAREEACEHLDVEAGLAGLVLAGASAAQEFPELQAALRRSASELLAAVDAADGMVPGIWKPGVAHGISGVGAALAQVGAVTGEAGWIEHAVRLLEREPGAGRWFAPGELPTGGHIPVFFNGWCHGPAGAALARALVPPALLTVTLEEQMGQARAGLVPLRISHPLSLCCGTLAVSEISLVIGGLAGDERVVDEARRVAAMLFSAGLWRRGLDPEAGLLDGLFGFLFHLARLVAPREVGSALLAQVRGGQRWS